jgi:hypothetical protein
MCVHPNRLLWRPMGATKSTNFGHVQTGAIESADFWPSLDNVFVCPNRRGNRFTNPRCVQTRSNALP